MGTDQGFPPGWSVAAAGPWRVHRRWVTSMGRQTTGRRLRRFVLGQAAPGMVEDITFDLWEIAFKLIWWLIKVVLLLVLVPVGYLLAWIVGLVETIGRVVLRRPWSIDGYARDGSIVRWKEPGMRKARVRRDAIRAGLAAGAAPQGGDIRSLPG